MLVSLCLQTEFLYNLTFMNHLYSTDSTDGGCLWHSWLLKTKKKKKFTNLTWDLSVCWYVRVFCWLFNFLSSFRSLHVRLMEYSKMVKSMCDCVCSCVCVFKCMYCKCFVACGPVKDWQSFQGAPHFMTNDPWS